MSHSDKIGYWTVPNFIKQKKSPEKLVLFDVDGTLVLSGVVHRNSFNAALSELFGIQQAMDWTPYFGRTDPYILADILKRFNIPQDIINTKIESTLQWMGDYYAKHTTEEQGKILPGVPELLETLNQNNCLCGLTTGNVERIASLKLGHYDLAKYFALGGFGTDHVERSKMMHIAIQKAEKLYGFKYNGHNVLYVGDTIHDVRAAREAQLPVVIVYNERNRKDDFQTHKPDLLLESMKMQREFLEKLNNL